MALIEIVIFQAIHHIWIVDVTFSHDGTSHAIENIAWHVHMLFVNMSIILQVVLLLVFIVIIVAGTLPIRVSIIVKRISVLVNNFDLIFHILHISRLRFILIVDFFITIVILIVFIHDNFNDAWFAVEAFDLTHVTKFFVIITNIFFI
ncbi:hypothetical protein HG531_002135 [Fusarium graminearum]|nr:hypothetical protein HG531_002135 [Fusarium graminearum]